jgi:hypothetical protein
MKETPEEIQKRLQDLARERVNDRKPFREREKAEKRRLRLLALSERMKGSNNPMKNPEYAKKQGLRMIGNRNNLVSKSKVTDGTDGMVEGMGKEEEGEEESEV